MKLDTRHKGQATWGGPWRGMRGWVVVAWVAALALASGLNSARAADPLPHWPADVVETVARMPVQDGGRVKPLDTFARFTLLRFSGSTRLHHDGKSLHATAWLMDCLFRPEVAAGYKCFLVEHPDIVDTLGLSRERVRDRYAYRDLAPARAKLIDLGSRFAGIPPLERTPFEGQAYNLAQNLQAFEQLIHSLDFARRDFSTEGLAPLLPAGHATLGALLEKAPALASVYAQTRDAGASPNPALDRLLQEVDLATRTAHVLALIPPPGSPADAPRWLTPKDVVGLAFEAETPGEVQAQVALVSALEAMAAQADDPVAFRRHAALFAADARRLAVARGEATRFSAEVFYHNAGVLGRPLFFTLTLALYLAGFTAIAAVWLRPTSPHLARLATVMLVVPTLLLVSGIVLRCYIRARPPVTTLYETILFVTAVVVAVALAMEWIDRRRVALSLAAVTGALGLFLANKYEAKEAADTMPSLIAVLDTNFWLSTHVTTVTIGYAAGLLAAGFAHVFVFAKLVGFRRHRPDFYAHITRMTYGAVCFGLVFSVLGTVLGGVWANDSWGRFWGWDPKENGALMIVLWELALLHAYAGGYLRDYGVNLAALVGGMIVGFSWFGTNLLGVGLHSYGFTQGIHGALVVFYGIETVVLFLGIAAWLWEEVVGVSVQAAPARGPAVACREPMGGPILDPADGVGSGR